MSSEERDLQFSEAEAELVAALRARPLAELPPEADARLRTALRTAENAAETAVPVNLKTGRRAAWWRRPIPLWQAAGAAAVLAAVVGWSASGGARPTVASSPSSPPAPVAAPAPSRPAPTFRNGGDSPAYTLDIRSWRVLNLTIQGESR